MSHQDGFSDNGPEATRLSKPDDCDDRMQQKSENVAHAPDRIRLQKLKNSLGLWNSPTTRSHRGSLSCGRKFHASSDIDRVSGQFEVTPQSRLIAYTTDNGDNLLDIAMEQSAGMGPLLTHSRLHLRNEGMGFVRFTHEASWDRALFSTRTNDEQNSRHDTRISH